MAHAGDHRLGRCQRTVERSPPAPGRRASRNLGSGRPDSRPDAGRRVVAAGASQEARPRRLKFGTALQVPRVHWPWAVWPWAVLCAVVFAAVLAVFTGTLARRAGEGSPGKRP